MDRTSSSFDLPHVGISARWARAAGRVTIVVSGELDIASVPPLQQRLLDGAIEQGDLVVLDLERVTFCGGAGVQLLVDLVDHTVKRGGRLVLRHPSPVVRKVLAITQLLGEFEILAGPTR